MNNEEFKKHRKFSRLISDAQEHLRVTKACCAELHEYLRDYNLLEEKEQILGKELARYV